MQEDDSSSFSWVAMRISSTSMTFVVLIQRRLLSYQTFQQVAGSMLSLGNQERLESGAAIISQMMDSTQESLNPFFVVPKLEVSATLLKYTAGTGRRKPALFLL